uniref:Uncharacterized protein n=1 Tax=Anguilla anguilla TaxID=7936 RepID=A0A0E9TJH6_ANGAN
MGNISRRIFCSVGNVNTHKHTHTGTRENTHKRAHPQRAPFKRAPVLFMAVHPKHPNSDFVESLSL